MLDLDHPQSAHVFAASNQLDSIRSYFSTMSWSDSKSRLSSLEIVRPCFVALRWIHSRHFADQPQIASLIDELEGEVEKLAHLGEGRLELPPNEVPPSRCPFCRTRLSDGTSYFRYFKRPKRGWWCDKCLEGPRRALERVESVEEGFGTEAI